VLSSAPSLMMLPCDAHNIVLLSAHTGIILFSLR
jgi:hypothetical protein